MDKKSMIKRIAELVAQRTVLKESYKSMGKEIEKIEKELSKQKTVDQGAKNVE